MTKPDKIKNDDYLDKIYTKIRADKNRRETIKSIALTDIHLDMKYKMGAPTKCPFTLCCREI